MKTDNIFDNIPKHLDKELFENLLTKDGVKIQRIISQAHTTPEGQWYDQGDNEWVIVLQGRAIISFEKEKDVLLGVGEYLNIPAHKRHRVLWTSQEEKTVWLAVHY